jgi:hypothetical protein
MTAARDPDLPFVDQHERKIAADPERVWRAVVATMRSNRRGAERFAALLGCRERSASGDLERPGSTVAGFRVVRAMAPAELALGGEHRFSRYALTFRIDDLGGGASRLRAITNAEFPGISGRAYRALVIGSGAHGRLMQGMVERIAARAAGPVG